MNRLHIAVASLTLLVAPLTLARSAPPTIADITPVIERMEAAANAGNGPAFLAEVDTADAVFLQEQKMWAKDLKDHTPIDFDIELSADELKQQADGTITVPLQMSWKPTDKARTREVNFTARFIERDGTWRYAGETWLRVNAPGVVVLSDPQFKTEAVHIAAVLPAVREGVHDILGIVVEEDQQVKVYAAMRHLQQSIYLSYTQPLGGWNEPGEAIKVMGNEGQSGRALRSLLAHEYGHCATFALGDKSTLMPWWVLEGVAEYCSAELVVGPRRMERQVARWASNDNLRSWDQLADFRGEAMNHMGHVYNQGHSMIRYIVDTYSLDKMRAWLRMLAGGATLDEASMGTLGDSWSDIDQAWRARLANPG